MQEVVPLIENQWLACNKHFTVNIINCDELPLETLSKKLVNTDLIVFTVFNTSIAKAAVSTRKSLAIDAPWIIYLHGQATIGMWPYTNWSMATYRW
jgi:hypothetical protein